jgi:hypothetical protein
VKHRVAATSAVLALAMMGPRATAAELPWGTLLRLDLEAMHRTLVESHPGAVDDVNRGFRTWLEEGYQQGLERASRCDSFDGYRYGLEAYAVGFQDGHLGVRLDLRRGYRRWPGFLVGHRDGKLVVRTIDEAAAKDLPPLDAELVSCDGRPARAILEKDVFPFLGNPAFERMWDAAAPRLLLGENNPWRGPLPKSCTFRERGATRTRTLAWRTIREEELRPRLDVAEGAPSLDFGIRPFGERGIWVTLPTFNGKDARVVPKLEAAIAQAPSWRDRDPIVFDVRTNAGGSSLWGFRMLCGLYGEDLVKARRAALESKEYVEWRVSAHNAAHMDRMVEQLIREQGPASPAVPKMRTKAAGMRQALADGRSLWREPSSPGKPAGAPPNPVAGRVFLLTDGSCGSACLDFADLVIALPGTTHVGRSTGADTVYMEAAYVPLPSGVAELGFATKVYRNRPRGNNESYVPRHRFAGDMTDTAALERWIQQLAAPRQAARTP